MNRRVLISLLAGGACITGVICGRLLSSSTGCRDLLGVNFGRGHLLALANDEGIYETDLERALAELRDAAGIDGKDRPDASVDKRLILEGLISDAMARSRAATEKISPAEVNHEFDLLRSPFQDNEAWKRALRASGLFAEVVRRTVAADVRTRQWIAEQIKPAIDVTAVECQNFYHAHPENFSQPARFRASHLFLAAPPETSPDVVEEKRHLIESLITRVRQGENFSELVALFSEDEATKTRGGDLGFFSALRMPSDFISAIEKMGVGEIGNVVRTRLGFHIVQLTDKRPARPMVYDEVQPEIRLWLQNEKREGKLQKVTAALLGETRYVRSTL
jgi:peptidyl-prolyl cis-trans isomerase C